MFVPCLCHACATLVSRLCQGRGIVVPSGHKASFGANTMFRTTLPVEVFLVCVKLYGSCGTVFREYIDNALLLGECQ